jgi:hypothetical protein
MPSTQRYWQIFPFPRKQRNVVQMGAGGVSAWAVAYAYIHFRRRTCARVLVWRSGGINPELAFRSLRKAGDETLLSVPDL